jgi:hypothetical protein
VDLFIFHRHCVLFLSPLVDSPSAEGPYMSPSIPVPVKHFQPAQRRAVLSLVGEGVVLALFVFFCFFCFPITKSSIFLPPLPNSLLFLMVCVLAWSTGTSMRPQLVLPRDGVGGVGGVVLWSGCVNVVAAAAAAAAVSAAYRAAAPHHRKSNPQSYIGIIYVLHGCYICVIFVLYMCHIDVIRCYIDVV